MSAEHEVVQQAAEASHPPELPNFIHVLHQLYGGNPVVDFLWDWNYQIYALLVLGFLTLVFRAASRHCTLVPGKLQSFAEMVIEPLLGIVVGILGEKEGRRYFPFLGALFLFIFCMNWSGLVPLMRAPTSNIKITAALAISVFIFVQYTAFTRLGPLGYLHHLMGEPQDTIGWCLVPLFLPLHILEELIKPLSLACRLFGNILGEDVLLGVGLMLGISLMTWFWHGAFIGFPLHLPFIFLSMLLGTIQALVFTLLASVYLSATIPHEHHEEHSK